MPEAVTIGTMRVGDGPFLLIAGPCVIEGRDITLRSADRLVRLTSRFQIPFVFKCSYDKANRTSVDSFRGPGLDEGLKILADVRNQCGIPVLTDVHSPGDVLPVAEVVDVLQIPALLCRQTDLLVACGRTGKPVNIKKGQFLAPLDMQHAVRKIESTGNRNILVTERGTTFGYNNLVNDFRSIPIMQEFGYPVVFDATHSVQLPGGAGGASAGQSRFAFPLSRAAIAVGADGIFMEVHENPACALCDGENSVPLDDLERILETLRRIALVRGEWSGRV
jgi:2-dehydro-3-deoxyphosphooctonate aldolase (KDO 8-P synthase)